MPGQTHILDTFSEGTVSQSSLANAWTHSPTGHIFREHCQPVRFGRKCLDTHNLDIFSESTVSQSSLAGNAWTLTIWTYFQRALSASPVWQKMPGHTHILHRFSESTVSQSSLAANDGTHSQPGHIFREHCQPVQFGSKCQDTLTGWTHFQRALSTSPVWQQMSEHTHSLGTFSESTVSQSSLAGNAWTHSHPGHIFREHCQPVQLAGNAWTHSPTASGHIFRERCQPVQFGSTCLDTHNLDIFSESTVSQSSLAGNAWTHSHSGHIFRQHCQPVQLAANAWTHSQPGHICREHCQPIQFGSKCLDTLTYWTHFQRALSASPVGSKCLDTLTAWTHLQRALSASPVWQETPGHTHSLDTFSESTVSRSSLAGNAWTHSQPGHIFGEHCQPVQFGSKCQDTLTCWTHLQRALSASPVGRTCLDTLTHWTHFQRALSASPVWQEMPRHTHSLHRFSESTVSQSSLAGNARKHSHSGHIFREHCQPVQFGMKCLDTLTAWTHLQRALSASPVWQQVPGHTHILDTFSESTVSQSNLA